MRGKDDSIQGPYMSESVPGKGKRVCIVGGGFGGLNTALQLATLQQLQPEQERARITLIDSGERCAIGV